MEFTLAGDISAMTSTEETRLCDAFELLQGAGSGSSVVCTFSAASVRMRVVITPPAGATSAEILNTASLFNSFLGTPALASAVLGVTVESVSPAGVVDNQSLNTVAAAVGMAAGVLILVIALPCCCCIMVIIIAIYCMTTKKKPRVVDASASYSASAPGAADPKQDEVSVATIE